MSIFAAISEGIGKLVNLDKSSVDGILNICKRMRTLPATLFELPYFTTSAKIDLSGWNMATLPEGMYP